MTVSVVPHGSKGYRLLRIDGEETADGRPRYVAVHRLVAYAHGELASLSQSLEVHHRDGLKGLNGPENLEALTPREHGQVTRQQTAQRRGAA